MLLKTTFFTGLDQIELPATSARGDRFADVYNLTTDRNRIAEIVQPLFGSLGNVETTYLLGSAKALIYRISEQEIDPSNVDGSLARLIINDMAALRRLQLNLWIMKDNAVCFDRAWIAVKTSSGITVNNNTWETRHSCADGTYRSVSFDSDELRGARQSGQAPAVLHMQSTPGPTMLTSGSLRFERFQYYIDIARSSLDVAMKLAQYCSGLEALVSTAQVELSHQVSERVAVTLAEPGEARVALFKRVKEAYGYRSKTVHGASFKQKDFERLRDCAKDIDQVCRALVVAYFDPDSGFRAAIEGANEGATDFFLNRTLGAY